MPKPAAKLELLPTTEPVLVTSTKLENQLQEYLEVCARLDQLKLKKDKLGADLKAVWHEKYGEKIQTEEFLSTLVGSHNSSINKGKLLAAGVKPTIIEAATVQTPYSYVKVTRKKEAVVEDMMAASSKRK